MGLKSYFWPAKCHRCKKTLGVGTKLSVLWGSLTSLGKIVGGKGGMDKRYTNPAQCSFCGLKK